MKNTQKLTMFVIIVVLLIPASIFPSPWNWLAIFFLTTCAGVILLLHSKKIKKETASNKLFTKEIRDDEKEKKAQEDLEQMRATSLLVKTSNNDLVLAPAIILRSHYEHFFAPFNRGDIIFPPIPLDFERLLETNDSTTKTIREFVMVESGNDPFYCFLSLKKGPFNISLSANKILNHFISNIGHWAERNWYILNTKPSEPPNAQNIKMVDIRLIKNADERMSFNVKNEGKFFLHFYDYSYWNMTMGGYMGSTKKSKFFAPIDSILTK